jgi:hypothetical protein
MLGYKEREREVPTFNNVAMLIVPTQASGRNAFQGYSSLHSEFCDRAWTIGVGLTQTFGMPSCGPYLLFVGTFVGVGTTTVVCVVLFEKRTEFSNIIKIGFN